MEPDPTVHVPVTGPLAAVLAAWMLPGAEPEVEVELDGDSDSAAGVLPPKKWM